MVCSYSLNMFSPKKNVSSSPGRQCFFLHLQAACSEAAGLMVLLYAYKDMGCRHIPAHAQGSVKQPETASASSAPLEEMVLKLKTGAQSFLLIDVHQLERITQLQGQYTAYSCKLPCTMALLLLKNKIK